VRMLLSIVGVDLFWVWVFLVVVVMVVVVVYFAGVVVVVVVGLVVVEDNGCFVVGMWKYWMRII